MAKIPIVDRNDHVLYMKERSEVQSDEIYRVSACRVMHPTGDILLAQRSFTKKHSPGMRGPAVAGTVTGDETYLENILHEIPEEIGITLTPSDLSPGPYYFREGKHLYFCQCFVTKVNLPIQAFTKEEGAVEQLKRRTQDELDSMIDTHPELFLDSVRNWREYFG